MTNLLLRLGLIQLLFAGVLFVQGYWYWLLNFELAFISATLIILGSFHGYKRMVLRRLDAGEGTNDELMQKIEDPHELYEDESTQALEIEEEKDLKTAIKEEKQRLKQNKQTLKKTIKSTPGLFSPLRFVPYIILVLSFIFLTNNQILDVVGFLSGVGAGVVAAIIIGRRWIADTSS